MADAEGAFQYRTGTPLHAAPALDADGRRLQEELAEALGAPVQLKPRSASKGSVVIDYGSLDELEGLVKRLKG